MESAIKPVIVFLIAVLAIVFWCIRTVNDFKKKEIRVQEGLSGIEVALTKRYDKLVKMLDIAKGYMTHESELFTKVIELRRGGLDASDCLMVGNDVAEDMMAGAKVGLRGFLLTDCLINTPNADIEQYPHGSFDELSAYIDALLAEN